MPNSQPVQPGRLNAARMIGSLVKKPDSGGMPMMASQPRPNVIQVNFMYLPQAAEAPDVDLVVHAVHDRAGAEEHVGLEEAVREQVDQGQRVRAAAEADAEEHVADLGHRRLGEHPLDVVLGAADDAPSSSVNAPIETTTVCASGLALKIGADRAIR